MGILNNNTGTVSETVQARLARHFLARLIHAARAAAIEQAVTGGLLAEVEHSETAKTGRKPKTKKDLAALLSIADFGDDGDFVGSGTPAPRGRPFRLGPRLARLGRARSATVPP